MNNEAILAELRRVQEANADGLLMPSEVVDFAKDPDTELHKHFTWDDSSAASMWRIEQARGIIQRVYVEVVESPPTVHRAFVSTIADRTGGGGYRDLESVMADPVLTRNYLTTALAEFRALQRKYKAVEALTPIFSAIAAVEKQATEPTTARKARKQPLAIAS